MNHTLVIAECGSTHDGDLEQARHLIEAARDCGADVAKFQFWSNADRLADRRGVPDEYRAIYKRYQMPAHWLPKLKATCFDEDIEFMATCYLPEDIETVAPFVKRFKVASFEATDQEFVWAHHAYQKETIVSCGMMTHDELERLLYGAIVRALHCISAYPAPIESMNLASLWPHDSEPSMFDGLSDHSRHMAIGGLAVAAGAKIVEAHLRLDETDPNNPDYAVAFSPAEFTGYVKNIRFTEVVMGDGTKRLQACEEPMAAYRVRS